MSEPYKCPYCICTRKSEADLALHIMWHHPKQHKKTMEQNHQVAAPHRDQPQAGEVGPVGEPAKSTSLPDLQEMLSGLAAITDAASQRSWEWWTSNSFRRIPGVLEPIVQSDGQADIQVRAGDMSFISRMNPQIARALVQLAMAAEVSVREAGETSDGTAPLPMLRIQEACRQLQALLSEQTIASVRSSSSPSHQSTLSSKSLYLGKGFDWESRNHNPRKGGESHAAP